MHVLKYKKISKPYLILTMSSLLLNYQKHMAFHIIIITTHYDFYFFYNKLSLTCYVRQGGIEYSPF